ncbi:ABC transporter substrate-binding protein [Sporosarcina sp. FSL W7-1349]|uniref:ABC transporter substrate-binding protein n=1 Tax=Sporosarcina sp. FSL W7-1349 TaxID=2921561 RepID=UPI0030F84842
MKKLLYAIAVVSIIAVLAACGKAEEKMDGGGEAEASGKTTEKAVEQAGIEITDALGQTLTFETAPKTFATLSSGDLDILLSLGAKVVGRPTSQAPVAPELEEVEQIGNPHQPNFEKIAVVHPDVLLASPSMKAHAENLERQGTKVIYTSANSVQEIQNTISMVGSLLNKEAEADTLNGTLNEALKTGQESITEKGTKTLLVYGAPGTYLAALPTSLSGNLLELAGGENIANDFPNEDQYPQYASLSVEKIIERNPEVVMLITHGEPEAVKAAFEKEMMKNPAWKNLDAVKAGRVIVLPSHLFGTNPGTKVVEAFHVMKDSLEEGSGK